jgi:hypothetical protein
MYIQINTWAFPYWPGYHTETPILARDGVEGQYGSRDDNQANMEMPMYYKRLLHDIFHIGPGISPRLPYQARQ